MFVITVEYVVTPETADAFQERVLRQASDSVSREPDCHVFEVSRDPEQPERFLLYERYTNEEAFDAHVASDHFKSFRADIADFVVSRTPTRWKCVSKTA
ncbi:MAG: putative quinol monooxygenase [Dichotomicrobium sp.]